MAVPQGEVSKRTWSTDGHKRTAYAYTLTVVREDGSRKRYRQQYPNRAEAQNALDALREELLHPPKPKRVLKTFDEVGKEYIEFKRAKGKQTVEEDSAKLDRFKTVFGADTPIGEITAQRIADYERQRVTETSRRGETVAPATVNRELAALRHMLKLAEEWGYVEKAPRIRLAKEPEGRIRWLEPDEEAKLLDACSKSRASHLAKVVTVALETGMRLGEVTGLTWDRVDLSRGVIRLEKTKSGRRREVPMRQVVYDLLAAMPEPREGRVWPEGSIRTGFENAVERAGIEDFHFHDTRHHFASWFVMRGGQLQALQRILGHQTLAMTLRYAHLSPEHLRTEIAKTERQDTSRSHDAVELQERAVTT